MSLVLFYYVLDGLLDDLQTSVNRTAKHLNSSSKSRDVQYLSPSNTTTVVQERSVSPGGVRKLKKKKIVFIHNKDTHFLIVVCC